MYIYIYIYVYVYYIYIYIKYKTQNPFNHQFEVTQPLQKEHFEGCQFSEKKHVDLPKETCASGHFFQHVDRKNWVLLVILTSWWKKKEELGNSLLNIVIDSWFTDQKLWGSPVFLTSNQYRDLSMNMNKSNMWIKSRLHPMRRYTTFHQDFRGVLSFLVERANIDQQLWLTSSLSVVKNKYPGVN